METVKALRELVSDLSAGIPVGFEFQVSTINRAANRIGQLEAENADLLERLMDATADKSDVEAKLREADCPESCHEGAIYTDLGHGDFDCEQCEWCAARDELLGG